LPRKGKVKKKEIETDFIYNSFLITKLINRIMFKGKRRVAEQIVYQALESAGKKLNLPPMDAFNKALGNVRPVLEVKARRVGGAT